MPLGQLETLLWYANMAASAWLVMAMLRQKLAATYCGLFFYLGVDVLQSLAGIVTLQITHSRGGWYFTIYWVALSLKLLLAFWIVMELVRYALTSYRALLAFARRVTGAAFGVALLLSVGALWLTPPVSTASRTGWKLQYFLAFERSMDFSILILLLSVVVFIGWFPVRLSRNAAYYLAGYFTYFLGRWVTNNAVSFAESFYLELNIAMLGMSMICLIALSFWLTQAGEREIVVPGHSWNPEAMARLRHQMDELEASLGRAHTQA